MAIEAITTVEQLDALDSDRMVAGYLAGFHNEPNYTERDRAYWHGYMNGQVDGGFMPISDEQAELARAVVASRRTH